jgi:hypothetical protein
MINYHAVESNTDGVPESILGTKTWLNWTGDFDNPNDSEGDSVADIESDIEQVNGIEDVESPEQQDVSAATNLLHQQNLF